MRAYRIADSRFPIFDGAGARLVGGRWSSPGRPVIYAAETFSAALLEALVHSNLGRVPKTHAAIEISIPDTIRIETLKSSDLPGWDAESPSAGGAFGDRWLLERRSSVLLVPSVIARDYERNVLINPEHPDFAGITAGEAREVQWDKRLFAR